MNERLLMTVDDVAEMLRMGARSIWRFRDMGKMPESVSLGKSVRWKRCDVEAWISAGCPDVRRTGWTPPAAGCAGQCAGNGHHA